ncbi:MAG: hypothetical protein Q7R93_01810 [bacterium]|nr:hypothetical protein [bacterium]
MLKKVLKWVGMVFVFAFMALVVYRGVFVLIPAEKTDEQVAKIHATKLTLDDVMGKNLPPVPSEPDKTVQGVDANENGIRDDVELAIFREYPDSAKTRAVLLQYALALQMEVTQARVNTGTVTAVAEDSGRAHLCVGEITSRDDMNIFIQTTEGFYNFVETKQWSTEDRKRAHKDFYAGNLGSYSSPDEICDLALSTLPN